MINSESRAAAKGVVTQAKTDEWVPAFGRIRVHPGESMRSASDALDATPAERASQRTLDFAIGRSGFNPHPSEIRVISKISEGGIAEVLRSGKALQFRDAMVYAFDDSPLLVAKGALLFHDSHRGQVVLRTFDARTGHSDYRINLEPEHIRCNPGVSSLQSDHREPSIPMRRLGMYARSGAGKLDSKDSVLISVLDAGRISVLEQAPAAERRALLGHVLRLNPEESLSEETQRFFKRAGVDSNDYLHLRNPECDLRFSIPIDLRGRVLVSLVGRDGVTELIPPSAKCGGFETSCKLLSRAVSADTFRWIDQDGRDYYGFVDHAPQMPAAFLAIEESVIRQSQMINDFRSTTARLLHDLSGRDFGFNVDKIVREAKVSARGELIELAHRVGAEYQSNRSFEKPGQRTSPWELIDQLNAIHPLGLREVEQSQVGTDIRASIGISPDRRVEFSTLEGGVTLSLYLPGNRQVHTVTIDPSRYAARGAEVWKALPKGAGSSITPVPDGLVREPMAFQFDNLGRAIELLLTLPVPAQSRSS